MCPPIFIYTLSPTDKYCHHNNETFINRCTFFGNRFHQNIAKIYDIVLIATTALECLLHKLARIWKTSRKIQRPTKYRESFHCKDFIYTVLCTNASVMEFKTPETSQGLVWKCFSDILTTANTDMCVFQAQCQPWPTL